MSITSLLQDQNPWWRGSSPALPPARRDLHATLKARLAMTDRRGTVLLGPRQVGKTTLLLQVAEDLVREGWPASRVTYFDFSDDRCPPHFSVRDLAAAVDGGTQPAADVPRIFLIDEAEYSSGWERFVKQSVDRRRDRWLVTTSAAAHLRDAGRESGVGRWDEIRMEGLTYGEFLRILDPHEVPEIRHRRDPLPLTRFLANGGFPEHVASEPVVARQRLRQYVGDRAILRDLLRTGVDVLRVQRLFVYLAQQSGGIVDVAKLATALEADARSVREWLARLRETQLIVPLRRHARAAAATLRDKEKVFAADHGLVRAFANDPAHPDTLARVFEATVFRHLRELGAECAYYRDRDDLEADFIVSVGAKSSVVEVTADSAPSGRKLARAREVRGAIGAARAIIVCSSAVATREGSVELLPIAEFLLAPKKVLP